MRIYSHKRIIEKQEMKQNKNFVSNVKNTINRHSGISNWQRRFLVHTYSERGRRSNMKTGAWLDKPRMTCPEVVVMFSTLISYETQKGLLLPGDPPLCKDLYFLDGVLNEPSVDQPF